MGDATQAIFLSYTSQDAGAVQRLCAGLRASGLTVWFDQNELRGGDAWDASIRRQIRDCALFMPVISANTEARPEGYFRLEWRLAVERFNLMADDHSFLMPVVIDGTNEAGARVPDRFRERQWTRLPGGECTAAFTEQIKRTLAAVSAGAPTSTSARAHPQRAAPARSNRPWMIAALAMASVLVAALIVGLVVSRRHTTTPAPAATATTAALTASPKSIAVLPFVNLTGKPEDAYLADGLQEEILSTLARLSDLKVISRTSTAEFRGFTPNVREIGNRLGVGSVLEGSVRREGRKMRLTVQLIDTRNDRHVLAADYDRDVGHILGLQTEVARKVADALSVTLSKYERGELDRVTTNSGDAYGLYLRAVAMWFSAPGTNVDGDQVRHLLEQSLHLDPQYADAAALLSYVCTMIFALGDGKTYADCSRDNYTRALKIDPQLPEAQLARGLYEQYVAKDLGQAMPDFVAVVRLRPNTPQAHTALGRALRKSGRMDEALAHFQRAWELDPLSNGGSHMVLTTLAGLRRLPELLAARRLFQQRFPSIAYARIDVARTEGLMQHSLEPVRLALRRYGGTLTPAERNRAEALLAREEGRYLDAAKLISASPVDDPDALPERDLDLGCLYWAAGKNEEAQRHFRAAEQRAQAILKRDPGATGYLEPLALAQSMLGEHAAALATIDRRRAEYPEDHDPVNGPWMSFLRSIILVRAGRAAEGYAEVARLLRVPFGSPTSYWFDDGSGYLLLIVKDDRHYDQIIHNPPRL
jgi:TolB-like protein